MLDKKTLAKAKKDAREKKKTKVKIKTIKKKKKAKIKVVKEKKTIEAKTMTWKKIEDKTAKSVKISLQKNRLVNVERYYSTTPL